MKKIHLLFLFFLSANYFGYAQAPDTTIAIANYSFTHVRDTNNADHPYAENMQLLIGKRATLYETADKAKIDSERAANFKLTGEMNITRVYTKQQIFFFNNNHQYFIKQNLALNNYLIEDEWPEIVWKINNNTRKIESLNCQQATGDWKGRTYTAWFCTDIPVHAGPWKLNGLPGLIIEAYDTKKQVVFKFAGYKTLQEKSLAIVLPKNCIKASAKDYDKLVEAFNRDRAGFINNSAGQTVITNTKPNTVSKGINNPIELPAKR